MIGEGVANRATVPRSHGAVSGRGRAVMRCASSPAPRNGQRNALSEVDCELPGEVGGETQRNLVERMQCVLRWRIAPTGVGAIFGPVASGRSRLCGHGAGHRRQSKSERSVQSVQGHDELAGSARSSAL